jgi:hypothetical protein
MVSLTWKGGLKMGGGYPEDPVDDYLGFADTPGKAPVMWAYGEGPFRFQRSYSGTLLIGGADDFKIFVGQQCRKIGRCNLVALNDHAIIIPMLTPESWPTDPQQCHDLLGQFAQQVEDLRAALEEAAKLHDQTIQERDQLVEELRRQIELYRRYVSAQGGNGSPMLRDRAGCSIPMRSMASPCPLRRRFPSPRFQRGRGSHASLILIDYRRFASSMTSRRPTRSATSAEQRKHALARMRHAYSSSSRPVSSFTCTCCPSMPAPAVATVW